MSLLGGDRSASQQSRSGRMGSAFYTTGRDARGCSLRITLSNIVLSKLRRRGDDLIGEDSGLYIQYIPASEDHAKKCNAQQLRT